MASGSLRREEMQAAFSRVTIINFNYDRTIEHFLFSELQTKFRLIGDEAKQALAHLAIIRPYGAVGPLPWQDGDTAVPFGAGLGNDHERLFAISQNIRTFTEQAIAHDIKTKIQAAIKQSRIIVILGFGFHQQNMSILSSDKPDGKRIFATVHNIDKENHENLARNIVRTFQHNDITRPPQLLDRLCYKLLQTMKLSIMAPV